MAHERAGQPAQPQDLVDLSHLVTAYYSLVPDPAVPEQQVRSARPATVGPPSTRRSTIRTSLAITQAIVEYRAAQGITGPLFIGRDTHALSEPALDDRARGARRERRRRHDRLASTGYTPTPACQPCDPGATTGRSRARRPTASSSPRRTTRPSDGGFKYNPPNGGPADSDATDAIADAGQRTAAGRTRRRAAGPLARRDRAGAEATTSSTHYVDDLPNVVDLDAIRDAGRADRRRPARRRQRRLLGRDRRAVQPRPRRGEPARRRAPSGS